MSERLSSVQALLLRHRRIAVDSNVLIYLLEGSDSRADIAADLVDAIGRGDAEGLLSSLGLAEILVAPALADDGPRFERAAATIRDLGFMIVAIDAPIAEDAAWIRGRTGASLPDAMHLACAIRAGGTVFVTNDRRMPRLPRLPIVLLEDMAA